MKHTRYVATTIAASCAFAAASAWADVANTSGSAPADREISRQIASEVIQNAAVGPYGVRVRTQDGRVHLTGSVGTIRDWMQADRDARQTTGVSEVQNDLSILIR